jgi:hypothetical protein
MGMLTAAQLSEIERFAETLGTNVQEAPDGSVNFVFDRLGTLSVVGLEREDRVVIGLSRLPEAAPPDVEARLLGEAGLDPADGRLIHAARCEDGALLLALEIPASLLSATALDGALSRLTEHFDRVISR